MADMTIEEAAAQLDEAVRAVRQLPWGESPPGTAKVLARYEAKKRALMMAVLEEILQTWDGKLTKEGAVKLMALRARIAALGGKDAS